MFEYIFKGCVYPRRINIKYSFDDALVRYIDIGVDGWLSAKFTGNEVVARFRTYDSFEKGGMKYIGCISSCINGALMSFLTIQTFQHGVGVSIDLESFVNPIDKEEYKLPMNVKMVYEKYQGRDDLFRKINSLFDGASSGWYVQKFLLDFNSAMQNAGESGFFCYRAIESLASFFKESRNANIDRKVWEKFRLSLDLDKEKLLFVKRYADPSRHGDTKVITESEKVKLFEITTDVFENFVDFVCENQGGILSALDKGTHL